MPEIGETRDWLTNDLKQTLETVVHQQASKGKRSYYILVHSKPDRGNPNVITSKVVLLDKQPMKFVGTTCFRVTEFDHVIPLWCLPLDAPGIEFPQEIKSVPFVAQSAQGAPILYGN